MTVFSEKKQIIDFIKSLKQSNKSVGFVPTMGALHAGHLSLVKKALDENDEVVVSIFVNPTQFNNVEDLKKYPRNLNKDVDLLNTVSKTILVFAPNPEEIYGDRLVSDKFDFDGLEHEMEGKFRAGHFDGVGTIVKRLFEIIKPTNAYFGEKDYQQLLIIKKLVKKYNIPVNIIGCEILREKDGLAMSSRNVRLKPKYREAAPFIYETLLAAKKMFGTKSAKYVNDWVIEQFKKQDELELEYFTIADSETLKTITRKSKYKTYRAFIAAYADSVRLIDNITFN